MVVRDRELLPSLNTLNTHLYRAIPTERNMTPNMTARFKIYPGALANLHGYHSATPDTIPKVSSSRNKKALQCVGRALHPQLGLVGTTGH